MGKYCKSYKQRYNKENKIRVRIWNNQANQRIKHEVISFYGGRCACCGEEEIKFLSIDHVNNGRGNPVKKRPSSIYRFLRKNLYPSGFQVLCFNCNLAKGFFGSCPHKIAPLTNS